MDIKRIKALAEIVSSHGLTALEISEGETKIRLERGMEVAAAPRPAPVAPPAVYPENPLLPQESGVDFNKAKEVKSPMVGVFYAAPSPDAPPYVKRGDKVKKGDVLCIIEAMKLLNEIISEEDGEIADICVQNGQVVEFSQTLFKIC